MGVIISALTRREVLEVAALPPDLRGRSDAALLAYVYFYDRRGGACETECKGDKQGLGLTKRNRKRFAAQEVLVQLTALPHNLLFWAKAWLRPKAPVLEGYGIQRLVRDLLTIRGRIAFRSDGNLQQIVLNSRSRLAHHCLSAFQSLLSSRCFTVCLGET